jgi:hypothetical protein
MKAKIKEQQSMNQKQPQELKQKVESTNTVQLQQRYLDGFVMLQSL